MSLFPAIRPLHGILFTATALVLTGCGGGGTSGSALPTDSVPYMAAGNYQVQQALDTASSSTTGTLSMVDGSNLVYHVSNSTPATLSITSPSTDLTYPDTQTGNTQVCTADVSGTKATYNLFTSLVGSPVAVDTSALANHTFYPVINCQAMNATTERLVFDATGANVTYTSSTGSTQPPITTSTLFPTSSPLAAPNGVNLGNRIAVMRAYQVTSTNSSGVSTTYYFLSETGTSPSNYVIAWVQQ